MCRECRGLGFIVAFLAFIAKQNKFLMVEYGAFVVVSMFNGSVLNLGFVLSGDINGGLACGAGIKTQSAVLNGANLLWWAACPAD